MQFDLSQLARRRAAPTVVFLGAGAGMADGLPSTDGMAAAMAEAIVESRLEAAYLALPSFRAFLKGRNAATLMDLLADVTARGDADPVAHTLFRVLGWAAARSADLPQTGVFGLRRRLLQHLYARDTLLYVMTTNWDTSLDTIARDLAGPAGVNYGLHLWSTETAELESAGKPLHLYKLNGSPDWFVCARCVVLTTAEEVRVAHDYPPDWQHLDYDPYCQQCGEWVPRVMVLPTSGQAVHPLGMEEPVVLRDGRLEWRHVRLRQMQTQATFALTVAEEILFVGYSMPPYDVAIRDTIEPALRGNALVKQGRANITVVARGDDATMANFQSLLGGAPFRFVSTGLDGYLEEIGA